MRELGGSHRAAKQRPALLAVARDHLQDRSAALPYLIGDAAIDDLHLAGLALEGGVQLAAQHGDVFLIYGHQSRLLTRKIRQDAITVGELAHQHLALAQHAVALPMRARDEQFHINIAPTPCLGERAHQVAPPTHPPTIICWSEALVDLEI